MVAVMEGAGIFSNAFTGHAVRANRQKIQIAAFKYLSQK